MAQKFSIGPRLPATSTETSCTVVMTRSVFQVPACRGRVSRAQYWLAGLTSLIESRSERYFWLAALAAEDCFTRLNSRGGFGSQRSLREDLERTEAISRSWI